MADHPDAHKHVQRRPGSASLLGRDFWLFFTGQTLSSLGAAFTRFALPLLVFHLTGSSVNLALTVAATFLPVVLFGLPIGVWVDRVDRKRLMIATDIGRALVIMWLPLLAVFDRLAVEWIYAVAFVNSLLAMIFETSQFSAIVNLVPREGLVSANGRLQASYSITAILGSVLGGLLIAVLPLPALLLGDALSYLASAGALMLIRRRFNRDDERARQHQSLETELLAGIRFVRDQPVLLSLALMLTLINFVGSTPGAQLVLFAKHRLEASDTEVGLLYAAGGAGAVLLSLLASRLRQRWSFSRVALGALMGQGLTLITFAAVSWHWGAMLLWALAIGLETLFNVTITSLAQRVIPDHLMGRVISVLRVIAWSAIPLGTMLGGIVIAWTGQIALTFTLIGALVFLIALAFSFTPLRQADLEGS